MAGKVLLEFEAERTKAYFQYFERQWPLFFLLLVSIFLRFQNLTHFNESAGNVLILVIAVFIITTFYSHIQDRKIKRKVIITESDISYFKNDALAKNIPFSEVQSIQTYKIRQAVSAEIISEKGIKMPLHESILGGKNMKNIMEILEKRLGDKILVKKSNPIRMIIYIALIILILFLAYFMAGIR